MGLHLRSIFCVLALSTFLGVPNTRRLRIWGRELVAIRPFRRELVCFTAIYKRWGFHAEKEEGLTQRNGLSL